MNQKHKEICQYCKKEIPTPDFRDGTLDYSEVYEYRGFVFHADCLDAGQDAVEGKRQTVSQELEHSIKSQANGEWMNGGYKKMKVDSSGNPIPSVLKIPQNYKNYEDGKL